MTDRQKHTYEWFWRKEIEFTFTQRNGGTRKRKMVLKVWYLILTVDTMNLPEYTREMMSKYMTELPCETCHGKRLSKEALSVYVGDYNIGEVVEYSIKMHFIISKT